MVPHPALRLLLPSQKRSINRTDLMCLLLIWIAGLPLIGTPAHTAIIIFAIVLRIAIRLYNTSRRMLHQHVIEERITGGIILSDISVERLVKQLVAVLALVAVLLVFVRCRGVVLVALGVNIVVDVLLVDNVIVRIQQRVVQSGWVWIFLRVFVFITRITRFVTGESVIIFELFIEIFIGEIIDARWFYSIIVLVCETVCSGLVSSSCASRCEIFFYRRLLLQVILISLF